MKKEWLVELLWWIISALAAVIVIFPIYQYNIDFPFYYFNILFVFLGISLARTILMFDTHPLRASRVFKVLLIFLVPLLVFPLIEGLHSFIEFNDREDLKSLMGHMDYPSQKKMAQYIRVEYIFFGILCFTGVFLMIIKMIRSLWRQYKYALHNK